MITLPSSLEADRLAVSDALASETALTTEQVAALASELATDPEDMGYAGKSDTEKLRLLNTGYSRANSDPQGLVERATIPRDQYTPICTRIVFRGDQLTNGAATAWGKLRASVLALANQQTVNLEDPDVQAGIAGLTALGILALREGESVSLGDQLTKHLDPAWAETVSYPSRAEVLFGAGAAVTLADLEAAS